jgi:ketopantoate reductase
MSDHPIRVVVFGSGLVGSYLAGSLLSATLNILYPKSEQKVTAEEVVMIGRASLKDRLKSNGGLTIHSYFHKALNITNGVHIPHKDITVVESLKVYSDLAQKKNGGSMPSYIVLCMKRTALDAALSELIDCFEHWESDSKRRPTIVTMMNGVRSPPLFLPT